MSQTMHGPVEVATFVGQVRDHLVDLTDEEREELVGGLEADLSELVADGGSIDQLDPATYAAELRGAAGLEVRRSTRGRRRTVGGAAGEALDWSRARLDTAVATGPAAATWAFLVTLRPLWWFFRAWLAAQLLDVGYGPDLPTPVPTLMGVWPGVLVTVAFTVVSVQIGRARWWPGLRAVRSVGARLALLLLNAFAIVVTPLVLGQFPASGSYTQLNQAYEPAPAAGLQNRGSYVENVFPYDAEGRPLRGVQLFDQDGRPLGVARSSGFTSSLDGARTRVRYPWFNGDQRLFNVFPEPERLGRGGRVAGAWTSGRQPTLPNTPLAVVPPASLPTDPPSRRGVTRSRDTPTKKGTSDPSADSEKPGKR